MSPLLALPLQLRLVGGTLVVLGLAHVALPHALAWPREFAALSPLTSQILYVHTLFIGTMCVLLGLAPLTLTADLLAPGRMSTAVRAAECTFWGLRWCVQFAAFRPALWRGSRLHTAGYIGFALLWTWIVTVFAAALVT